MKIFLKQDVPNVGEEHEIVEVADGYARNYLLPQGFAVRATEGRIRQAREIAASQRRQAERAQAHAEEISERLGEITLTFTMMAGETGRLYGSVTSADVADRLEETLGDEFDRRWLGMEQPIRELGEHMVDVNLEGGVRGQVKVVVEAEDES
jgi:large subunit ribosomal protein L9